MPLSGDLQRVLNNRTWIYRNAPFPHLVASQVFKAGFYSQLETAFNEVVARGFGKSARQFSRRIPNYDAYSINFGPDLSGPLSIFVSCAWHEMLAKLTGVKATGHVNACMHHHTEGGANGRVHNDLNPGWFIDYSTPDGIWLARHDSCSYKYGTVSDGTLRPREVIRAVVMLFYLCNPGWAPGDGGETGLYRSREDRVDRPAAVVPPINNSLLTFECTPYSYHSFLSNARCARNSVIMWLHREKEEVVTRWGTNSVVCWPRA